MSDHAQPYDCTAFERDLHLVVGGDLDRPALQAAGEHLEACAACAELAERAGKVRQHYFEAASRAAAEPCDLWAGVRRGLVADGRIAGVPRPAPQPEPSPLEVAALSEVVAPDEIRREARAEESPVVTTGGSGRRAVFGLVLGAAAAGLLILIDPTAPRSAGQAEGSVAVEDQGGSEGLEALVPGALELVQPASFPSVAEAESELASPPNGTAATGGLRPITADERLKTQGSFQYLYLPTQPVPALSGGSGAELASFPKGVEYR